MPISPKLPPITWDEARIKAKNITDKLGKPLDKGIKDTVMTLWMHGFNTTASCEGHLRWGLATPWVDFGIVPSGKTDRARHKVDTAHETATETDLWDDWMAFHRLKAKLHYLWLPELSRLMDLVLEFSAERPQGRQNLTLSSMGDSGARLISHSTVLLPHNSLEERKAILSEGRQEMQDFTEFLQKRILSGKYANESEIALNDSVYQ